MRTDHEVPTETLNAPGPTVVAPVVLGRRSSDAEQARTLAAAAPTGVLSTVARDEARTPFGSLAPFGLDGAGRPVFCISELAEHTRNLQADGRSSLLVARSVEPGTDPLAAARLTLVGKSVPVPDRDREAAREAHLSGNPHASYYVDFGDFSLWRLEITAVRYVGGYGRMSWVDLETWAAAEPDPVDGVAAGAIEHMNADHGDACVLMARHLGQRPDATEAVITAIDRYGVDFTVTGTEGVGPVRLGFDEPVSTGDGIRRACVALTHRARALESDA